MQNKSFLFYVTKRIYWTNHVDVYNEISVDLSVCAHCSSSPNFVILFSGRFYWRTQLYNVNRSNYRTNGMEAKIENLCRMDDFRVHKSRKMSLNSLTHNHRGDGVMKGMKRSYFLSLSQSLDSRQHESENLLIISYHKQYWMIYRFLHKHKEWTWYNLIMWNTTSTRCSPTCYRRRTMRKKV